MRKATRIVAQTFGILAGIAGLIHGITEILQGNVHQASLMFPSIGPPCAPEIAWHACEPAMTILPNLLVAGILTIILGIMVVVWSAAFVQRKNGGVVLILLSIVMLLFGGGIIPPVIGLIGGATGTQINQPLTGEPRGLHRFAAKLWPWPLVILVAWSLGQYLIGYLSNEFLKSIIGFGLLLMVATMLLSVYSAYSHDLVNR